MKSNSTFKTTDNTSPINKIPKEDYRQVISDIENQSDQNNSVTDLYISIIIVIYR